MGGIGVSGDGVDQDNLISFLRFHSSGFALNTGIGAATACATLPSSIPERRQAGLRQWS
jgi:hypothetical protein